MFARTTAVASLCLTVVLSACSVPDAATSSARDEAPFVQQTFTYKTVGGERIEADVYRAEDQIARPVLVWIHGGALMRGTRANPPYRLLDLCRIAGCVLVSIDYRLAPNEELPTIIEDLEDVFAWIRNDGPGLFAADTDRIVVAGGSAGGYLTLASGHRVRPRPSALVSYWGYGALNTFDAEPSEWYRTFPLVSEEEAWSEGGGPLYVYLRQQGLWTHVVSGFDPVTEAEQLTEYAPIENVTADYPPTLLIHGTADNDVPVEESVTMAEELARHGVAHELILLSESGHGLGGGDPALESDAHNSAVAFIHRHLFGEARSAEIEPLLQAFTLIQEASTLAGQGNIAEAKDAYSDALSLEPRLPEKAWMSNRLCWQGGLWAQAAEVLSECDRAVALTTSPSAGILDSRALVRALTGDIEGAMDDLEAVLDIWANEDAWHEMRQGWLTALRAGENPYTSELLKSLRDQ